ncbi:hypothetical protein [Providencia phage PSTCR6]|nr:hypothetical protein [Providencia phage PSTCR6]
MTKINIKHFTKYFDDPLDAIYLIKLYLKTEYNIPVILNPLNVYEKQINVYTGEFEYRLNEKEHSFEFRYRN